MKVFCRLPPCSTNKDHIGDNIVSDEHWRKAYSWKYKYQVNRNMNYFLELRDISLCHRNNIHSNLQRTVWESFYNFHTHKTTDMRQSALILVCNIHTPDRWMLIQVLYLTFRWSRWIEYIDKRHNKHFILNKINMCSSFIA